MIAGPGDQEDALKKIPKNLHKYIDFLGPLSEVEKAQFFKSLALYVAPNNGGESFGIILGEAMACRIPIVASDLPAFKVLLEEGKYGQLFKSEDSFALSVAINDLLSNPERREILANSAMVKALELDWERVARAVFGVYELALSGGKGVQLSSEKRIWNRFRAND